MGLTTVNISIIHFYNWSVYVRNTLGTLVLKKKHFFSLKI